MSVLLLEPVGGIAGDMFLAAALDLGVPLASLEAPLRTVGALPFSFRVTAQKRHDISGTHLEVQTAAEDHAHRRWGDIHGLIEGSQLPARAKLRAQAMFRALGEVEAAIHGTTLESVHFHEVGGVDSIIDICGAALVLELLGDPTVYCTPPPMGSGTVRIAHGVVPVPVPATLALLKGVPVRFEGVGELTTPTGAALVKVLTRVEPVPPLIIERIGYGLGTRDPKDRANVLRASMGRLADATAAASQSLVLLECNVDDQSPELLALAVEHLLAAGALDAWLTPIVMKKGRAAHQVSALGDAETLERLKGILWRETSTLGVRLRPVTREALVRRIDSVPTPYGPIRVKVGLLGNQVVNAAPEFEDVRVAAETHQVAAKEVYASAQAVWRGRL